MLKSILKFIKIQPISEKMTKTRKKMEETKTEEKKKEKTNETGKETRDVSKQCFFRVAVGIRTCIDHPMYFKESVTHSQPSC